LFFYPAFITKDSLGNFYVTDWYSGLIRKIDTSGFVSTLAGSGSHCRALDGVFHGPNGIAVDSSGNVFVVDSGNHVIRKINSTGEVTVFAGKNGLHGWSDGQGADAMFHTPSDMAIDSLGNLFVADTYNNVIRKINASGYVTTVAGAPEENGRDDGQALFARFDDPTGIKIDAAGNLFVSERCRIRMIFMGTSL
jgi:DNA-binding beta-propeller fold protein YncE